MFVSKFWFTLLALAMGAAIAALLLARHSHNLALEDDTRALLFKDREQVWALLKSESRVRLDEMLRVTSDQDVMRVLEKATQTPEQMTSDDRAALEARLRQQNENLESFAGDLLVAVDRNGDAVAHVWEGGPQKARYGLGGFPAVDSALRGFMQDDVWALSTDPGNPNQVKVFRVACRPVISKGQYVGAVVHGQYIDSEFATLLAQRLEAQIVFFRGSVVLSSAVPGPRFEHVNEQVVVSELTGLLEDETFISNGYSSIVPLGEEAVALYSLIQGEAALVEGSRVGYAIVRPIRSMDSSLDFLTNATLEEWRGMAISPPGIALCLSVFLALLLGYLAFFFEHGRPLRLLRRELSRLADRQIDRLNVYGVARSHRTVAESINKAIDRAVADVAEKLGKRPADIDQILGPRQGADRVSSALFTFPDAHTEDVPPPPPPPAPPPAPVPERPVPLVPGGPAKAQPAAHPPAGRGGYPPVPPAGLHVPPAPHVPPVPNVPQHHAAAPQAPPPSPMARPLQHAPAGPAMGRQPPVPAPTAPGSNPLAAVPSSRPDDDDDEDDKTEIAGVPEELLGDLGREDVPEDEGTYFKQVFEKFIDTKRQCGERIDNLQFERFTQTLRRNRAALVERYGCKNVRFQVYVKDGKAALKATPVRG